MTGYEVVPGSLRKMAQELENATEHWRTLADSLAEFRMHQWDLGPAGLVAEYPERYEEAADKFSDKIREGADRLAEAAPALNKVADYYLAKEEEYYLKFGYSRSHLATEDHGALGPHRD